MLQMLTKKEKRLRKWDVAVLVLLGLWLLFAGTMTCSQASLSQRLLRFHVVANSDSSEDQALKLEVRNAVLQRAEELLADAGSVQEAEEILRLHLPELARVGQQAAEERGCSYRVSAGIETEYFPTREYDTFALPAGNYRALRVVIGEGEGHNWWCVVFPSLCVAPVAEFSESAVASGLTREDVALITGENEGYVLKFKCMELWGSFLEWAGF